MNIVGAFPYRKLHSGEGFLHNEAPVPYQMLTLIFQDIFRLFFLLDNWRSLRHTVLCDGILLRLIIHESLNLFPRFP